MYWGSRVWGKDSAIIKRETEMERLPDVYNGRWSRKSINTTVIEEGEGVSHCPPSRIHRYLPWRRWRVLQTTQTQGTQPALSAQNWPGGSENPHPSGRMHFFSHISSVMSLNFVNWVKGSPTAKGDFLVH